MKLGNFYLKRDVLDYTYRSWRCRWQMFDVTSGTCSSPQTLSVAESLESRLAAHLRRKKESTRGPNVSNNRIRLMPKKGPMTGNGKRQGRPSLTAIK